ncbi:MAG: 2-isopropylmalate synthase [Burkholderiaceae bacterium]|nr:MAG: 2-isopropylmalate synthase [Burkholderiaceae bacterium]
MLQQPGTKYKAFEPIRLQARTWPDARITHAPIWTSIDLRDGNQALVEPMDVARKMRMFETLVKIGFKQIEVGFPSASQPEFDFVRKLIDEKRIPEDVTIQVLTQARDELIARTFEALRGVSRAIVHMYVAVAPIMRRTVLNLDEDGIVELSTSRARLIAAEAAKYPETDWTFEYSPEMFSDTDLAFSKRVVDAVTAVWQPTPARKCIINLPSTVERSSPNIYADMIEWMHRHIARRDAVILSVHPHNDRGTGTAAAEFALMAGADRLEGCLFGNGERTGNLDLVNVALNMYTQGVAPHLDFSHIDEIRATVEQCNQLPIHPRHPYVGDLVYTSFSGSHQDAIKKAFAARQEGDFWEMPYLPIDPKDVGRSYEAVIRVNSQSGKGGISYLLESEYGLTLPRRLQIEFSHAVQRVMDAQGKELGAADLWTIFHDEYGIDQANGLRRHTIEAQHDDARGTVRVRGELAWNDATLRVDGRGNGPIAAFTGALGAAAGHELRIMDYQQHAIGDGADAQSVAYIEMRVDDSATLFGVGMDADTTAAAFKALISGVQRAEKMGIAPRGAAQSRAAADAVAA